MECEKEFVSCQNRGQVNFDRLLMARLLMKTATSEELRCCNEVEKIRSYCACEVERARVGLEAKMNEDKELDSSL